MEEFREGILRFQRQLFPQIKEQYETAAAGQKPLALVLTCADSRIDPEAITQSGPGRIFVERNPGNLVPIHSEERVGVSASIEYAVAALGVPRIIVLGHSDCGAMKALLHPEKAATLPSTERWLEFGRPALERLMLSFPSLNGSEQLERLTEINVLVQIEHLKTHPTVRRRLEKGEITLHGWIFEIHTGKIRVYDTTRGAFFSWPE